MEADLYKVPLAPNPDCVCPDSTESPLPKEVAKVGPGGTTAGYPEAFEPGKNLVLTLLYTTHNSSRWEPGP